MGRVGLSMKNAAWVGIALALATGMARLVAQGAGGERTAQSLFAGLDADGDGALTRSEIEAVFGSWLKGWDTANHGTLTGDEIAAGLSKLLPAPPAVRPGQANTFNNQGNSTPIAVQQKAVDAMMAALPTTQGVKPLQPRKVLVLAHTGAGGFVHASIPLAAKTVEALGNRGGLWTTTVTYDAADISRDNLKQYDAIFLDSTTACFLDDKDASVTAARRSALLDFVRSGKGMAGIHAATDAYHTDCVVAEAAAREGSTGRNIGAMILAARFMTAGDKDHNGVLSREEWTAIGDDWFQKLDTEKAGKIGQADFVAHFNSLLPPPDMRNFAETKPVLQWPEYNALIGGYFKFHWGIRN